MNHAYQAVELSRAEIDVLKGLTLLEFGAAWCSYCSAAQPLLEKALAAHPQVRHIKIADGKGRRLGRSFNVTLWPTLVLLQDGREIARLVRPQDAVSIHAALAQLDKNSAI